MLEPRLARDLPDLELMLGRVVIAAEAAVSLAIEAEPFLYHGSPPDDCCPGEGGPAKVAVWWSPIDATGSKPCGGPIPVTVHIRQLVCWPVPENPVHADPGPFTKAAAYLARAADVGTKALAALICDRQAARHMGIARIEMIPTTPRVPRGGCAGIDWTLKVWPTGQIPDPDDC